MIHQTPGRMRLATPPWNAKEAHQLVGRLRAHPRVRRAAYNAPAQSLTIEHDPRSSVADIIAHLPAAAAELPGATTPSQPLWRQAVVPAAALAAGLSGVVPLASLVIGACATPITNRAVRSVLQRRVSIDVLDSAAVTLLLGSGDVLAAGVSVALIETGERIRARASGRARRVLRSWMGADQAEIRVVREGSEPRIPAAEIQVRDRVVVYAGETIPVDGLVVAGTGVVDNQTWTGEPTPVDVAQGRGVLAGSRVVDGRLVIDVRATGERTRAGRLAAALEDAIAANTEVSDLARRIADRFVLPILGLGAAVFLGTGDLRRLISILIVDFGTGIRIAVPTSVLTTMITGARSGILFRNGRAIEELATVDTIIFDKTGTLTTGHPAVLGMTTVSAMDEDDVLRLAAAAEGHLPHPIARAIRRHARRLGMELPEPETVHYQQGGGVEAVVDGHHVLVGGQSLLTDHGVLVPADPGTESSVVMIAINGRFAARLVLRDRIRSDAGDAITAIRRAGIDHVWLATGDRANAARIVARKLRVDGYRAGMLPEDKVELVALLRSQGHRVAVVGDGINDAAAMAEANVGIAVPRGADLARETADVVLGSDDLMTLVTAVRLSRGAMALVRQNIGLVAVPNAIGLGFAAAGALPPLAATAVNNGSTLLAAVNALRPLRT